MTDYISREAAFDAMRKIHNPNTARAVMSVVALRELPAADVVEVKHGEWIKDRLISTGGGTYGVCRCSVCKSGYQDVGYGFDYCPYCGAKMDGGIDK